MKLRYIEAAADIIEKHGVVHLAKDKTLFIKTGKKQAIKYMVPYTRFDTTLTPFAEREVQICKGICRFSNKLTPSNQ